MTSDLTIACLGCNSEENISLHYSNRKLNQPYMEKFLSVQTDRWTKSRPEETKSSILIQRI